ncbi:MAG: FkbM family methyltransferase, partial [Elusimicrobia bacterium]|nr:FkbM family methyltransferase [Elusimicrobiota bacterium]
VRMTLDLHAAFDPLFQVHAAGDYAGYPDFVPRAGQTVLDVGGNVGTYALWAARRVGPSGRVAAVEPHPGNQALLRANAGLNGFSWLTVSGAAAGDAPGKARLYIHPRAINFSLVRPSAESVDVDVATVDVLAASLRLPPVSLMKVDVEGSEPAVLRGARGLLERDRPLVALERDDPAQASEVESLLRDARYVWADKGAIRYAWPVERAPAELRRY